MGNVWERIEAELATRPAATGREVAWLAAKLRCRVQVVNNWKARGVPPARYEAIAGALGWTVNRLLGTEAPPDLLQWPFEFISRKQWDSLTERQRGAVEAAAIKAMRELPEPPAPLNTSATTDKRH